MKSSSIRISNNGRTIRAPEPAAAALFAALTEKPEPKGMRFYSRARQQEMIFCQHEGNEWDQWLFYKHPDGQWVSLRRATEADIAELAQAVKEAES